MERRSALVKCIVAVTPQPSTKSVVPSKVRRALSSSSLQAASIATAAIAARNRCNFLKYMSCIVLS